MTTRIAAPGVKKIESLQGHSILLAEVVKLANDRLPLLIEKQNRQLAEKIQLIKSRLSMRGLGNSGAVVQQITQACCQAIEERGEIIWKTLYSFATDVSLPYSTDLASEFKGIVMRHLNTELSDLRPLITRTAELIGLANVTQSAEAELEVTRERVVQTIFGNIDVFVLARKSGVLGQSKEPGGGRTADVYVDSRRIEDLRGIVSDKFDLLKLIELCVELNNSYSSQSYLTVGMLVRAVLDHVPPIFECRSFGEIANNYKGTKSFKDSMSSLENSLRNIADAHLHTQIRKKESLPTKTQVNFSADLDVLLAEIYRILK